MFQDENIKVYIIPHNSNLVDYFYLKSNQYLPIVKNSAVVYIIECKPFSRKFLPEKAKQLGIKTGPLFGKLLKGETVEVNGNLVTIEQVSDPSLPQPVTVVLDLPNTQICKTLAKKLEKYKSTEYDLSLFLHFTDKSVILTEEYIEMLLSFPNANNVILDTKVASSTPVFLKSESLLFQLNKILPSVFSLPQNPNIKKNLELFNVLNQAIPNSIYPNLLSKIVVGPINKKEVDRSEEIKQVDEAFLNCDLPMLSLAKSSSCNYTKLVDTSLQGSDPQILFLGTASMKPGSHRNVSAIHLSQ